MSVLKSIIGVYSVHPTAPLSFFPRIRSLNLKNFYNLDKKKLTFQIPVMRLTVYRIAPENSRNVFSAVIPPALIRSGKNDTHKRGPIFQLINVTTGRTSFFEVPIHRKEYRR